MSEASEKWEAMTPRERDAWVAEHLYGWKNCRIADGTGETEFETSAVTKGSMIGVMPGGVRGFVMNFTNHADSDHTVLNSILHGWTYEELATFSSHLKQILQTRSTFERQRLSYAMNYQPGDYSHAAYLTLTETP